jgi:STE24 endopeptidase
MLYVFNQLAHYPYLKDVLGMQQNSFHATLLVGGLLFAPINLVTGLLMHIFSRKNEYEADQFAKNTYNGQALAEGLRKLSADSLSNLTPHPWYVFFNYAHPTLALRLRRLAE